MQPNTDLKTILDMIPGPAVATAEGLVVCCNAAAAPFAPPPGEPIEPLLLTGREEYARRAGILFLTVQLADRPHPATLTPMEGWELLRIEADPTPPELSAIALVCAEMRDPVSRLSLLTEQLSRELASGTLDSMRHALAQTLRILNNASFAEGLTPRTRARKTQNAVCVVEEVLSEAGLLLEQAGHRLHLCLPKDPVSMPTDEISLRQAIYSLLDNAAAASEPGSPIDVALTLSGSTLRLSVTNRGSLSRGAQAKLFDAYRRQPGPEDLRPGAGLGMTLVRNAAAIHDGTVLVDSPGEGLTRVSLLLSTLPVQEEQGLQLRQSIVSHSRCDALVMLSNVLPQSLYGEF